MSDAAYVVRDFVFWSPSATWVIPPHVHGLVKVASIMVRMARRPGEDESEVIATEASPVAFCLLTVSPDETVRIDLRRPISGTVRLGGLGRMSEAQRDTGVTPARTSALARMLHDIEDLIACIRVTIEEILTEARPR